jgi:poly(3-hydroxybutyrate) depolymerase
MSTRLRPIMLTPSLRRLLACLGLVAGAAVAAPDSLPALGADPRQVSVSGLSSGAYMAVQLQVAYSSRFVGAGVIAGGPYYCAANNEYFVGICMGRVPWFTPNPALMARFAQDFARAGSIDALGHLRTRRIYLYSGTEDSVVRAPVVAAAAQFFRFVGVPTERIQHVATLPSGHAVITPLAGNACAANQTPFINQCGDYDQAGALLRHVHGPLRPPSVAATGQTLAFDQRAFAAADTSLSATGYLYVPAACSGRRCRLHVALHGCVQSVESVGMRFIDEAGYNRWADSNRMLVLYPQVDKSESPSNPHGCWDWWGYTGGDYAKKAAPQMRGIMAMVDRLVQRPGP